MTKLLKIAFTAFIVVMIVTPLPPSTIIGVALATNPKTGQYMDQRVYRAVMLLMSAIGKSTSAAIFSVANARERSATTRIATGVGLI
jgi:hypothetical protein